MKKKSWVALVLLAAGCAALHAADPASPPDARAMQSLVDRYGCMSCHGLVHKQVGPGFAQVVGRYRDTPGSEAMLADRIRNGGVGNWGRLVMPQQPRMTSAESMALAHWVMTRPGS